MQRGEIGFLHKSVTNNDQYKCGDLVFLLSPVRSGYSAWKLSTVIDAPLTGYGDVRLPWQLMKIYVSNKSFVPYPLNDKDIITKYYLNPNYVGAGKKRKIINAFLTEKLPVSKRFAIATYPNGTRAIVFLPTLVGHRYKSLKGYNTDINPQTVPDHLCTTNQVIVAPYMYDDKRYEDQLKWVKEDNARQQVRTRPMELDFNAIVNAFANAQNQ